MTLLLWIAIGLLIWAIYERERKSELKRKFKKEIEELQSQKMNLYKILGKAQKDYKNLQENTVSKSQFFGLQKECELLSNQIRKHIENF